MRRGSIVRMVIYGVLAGTVASLIAVLIPWLPPSASEQMDRIEFTFWFTTVICIGIFAIVAAIITYCVLKFRAAPDDERDGPPVHGHTGLEIVWTAVPAVLVTAISVVSAIVLAKNDDAGDNPLRVGVTAQQFAWAFDYPNEDGEPLRSGELVLPVNRPVKLTLHAQDVIHSFWVPEFGQKSDAVPGIETTLAITPTKVGSFSVVCTELCGLGHATMRAAVTVVNEQDYQAFLERLAAGPAAEPGQGGDTGEEIFTATGCGSCHAFEPAGTDAQVGPPLDDLAGAAENAGLDLEAFIHESIVDPEKRLAEGFQGDVMPKTYDRSLTDEQLDALVQYLVEGQRG
ncbi:MAG TPA: cytochrome c oxidase subunit II [Gaiellaceae bacterium]|nr:cytochrome c oxidase subunit II [Gaiellaceae bacterium]